MRKIPLADVGLLTTEEAAARREVNPRTVLRWVDADLLPAVVVREGRQPIYLFRPRDVDAASPRGPGAPPGNQNRTGKRARS